MKVPKRRDAKSVIQSHRRVVERVRKADIARVRDPVIDDGGGGGGLSGGTISAWAPLTDLVTLVEGVRSNPGNPARYAFDADFLYLRGLLDINGNWRDPVSGMFADHVIDATSHPSYHLADVIDPLPFTPPAAASPDSFGNVVYAPVVVEGPVTTQRVAECLFALPLGYMTLITNDSAFNSVANSAQISLDSVQLRWGA